jgi:predicted AAA+ superfamily ATPase
VERDFQERIRRDLTRKAQLLVLDEIHKMHGWKPFLKEAVDRSEEHTSELQSQR